MWTADAPLNSMVASGGIPDVADAAVAQAEDVFRRAVGAVVVQEQ